nr:hypothetical protein [Nigerium massiliense]
MLVLAAALIANGVTMLNKEGRSLGNLLSLLLGVGILAVVAGAIATLALAKVAPWLVAVLMFVVMICGWFGFLFCAYLLYAWLYPKLWKRPDPRYVIVHGSGLVRGRVPRLLGARVDEGIVRWQGALGHHPDATLIVSGGQGGRRAALRGVRDGGVRRRPRGAGGRHPARGPLHHHRGEPQVQQGDGDPALRAGRRRRRRDQRIPRSADRHLGATARR